MRLCGLISHGSDDDDDDVGRRAAAADRRDTFLFEVNFGIKPLSLRFAFLSRIHVHCHIHTHTLVYIQTLCACMQCRKLLLHISYIGDQTPPPRHQRIFAPLPRYKDARCRDVQSRMLRAAATRSLSLLCVFKANV